MIRKITFFLCLITAINFNAQEQLELSANPEYGQIFDIVHDYNIQGTIYARTVGNHIVKSGNDGQEWEILYSDPMDIYCTLSELKLINNGRSLSFIVKAEGTAYNKVILISPQDGSIEKIYNVPNPQQADVLIASYDIFEEDNNLAVLHTTYSVDFSFTNEVFLTRDGGLTYQSIYYGPDYNNIAVNNVAFAPGNSDKIFLMRGLSPESEFGGLFLTSDGGITWNEKIPGNTYSAIAFNPSNSQDIMLGTFYGYGSHQENLYRSEDGGETWNIVPINWTSMASDHINKIAFNPANNDNIIVLEENEIATTNDNGNTWQNQVYTEIDPEDYYYGLSVSFNPFIENEIIIGTDFYSFKSTNGGVTLEKLENPFVNSTGRIDIYTSSSENHLYYGLRNGFIHRDLTTGVENDYRLRSLNNTFGSTAFPYADKEIPGRVFTSSRYGMNSSLEMSMDHGENFESLFSSMAYLNIYEMATAPSNNNLVWVSFGDVIYKIDLQDPNSPQIGEVSVPNWELCYGLVIDPLDASHITISLGTKIYKTLDGGSSWEEFSEGLESLVMGNDIITDLNINPFNKDEYILGTTQGIFFSVDGGHSWSKVFEEFVQEVHFSSVTNGQIVGINLFSDGYLFPQSTTRIIYSIDAGENWEIISGEALEYLNSSSAAIQFYEEQADVYFGTFDMGLVKYSIDFSDLGTETTILSTDLILSPNPTSNFININNGNHTILNVVIYTVSGQKVFQVSGNQGQIDISTLTPGLFLVKIETDKGTFFKRVLKK